MRDERKERTNPPTEPESYSPFLYSPNIKNSSYNFQVIGQLLASQEIPGVSCVFYFNLNKDKRKK